MTITDYKNYFNSAYKGAADFDKNILSPILGKISLSGSSINYASEPDCKDAAEKANIKVITDVGEYSLGGFPIRFFDITLEDNCNLSMARVNIRKVVTRLWKEEFSGFIIVFHYDNPLKKTWRFSWVERRTSERNSTPGKRYTYLCGPSYSCRTIAERFVELENGKKDLPSITKAFDVEALSDEFFKEYKVMYDDIVQWITGQRIVKKGDKWKLDGTFGTGLGNSVLNMFIPKFGPDEGAVTKAVRDYVKKLMGRLVFIQFLQKKDGWLTIDGKATSNFLLDLYNGVGDISKDNFIEKPLKQVVYLLLNNKSRKSGDEKIDGLTLGVPFLNGGLFEPDEYDTLKIQLPKEFFHNPDCQDVKRELNKQTALRPDDQMLKQCGILDLFNHYNFTIDENDSNNAEVGVDPEMLGKIFENLLEDNKEKGAFYTPKEIVQYMCKESLIAYLCTKVPGCDVDIRAFVEDEDKTEVLETEKEKVLDALWNVKICDPAIGSGAFPMGLLNLLVALREKLEPNTQQAELKKEIIQNNIYGVDIEKGAIDIARLRFWLSIMVDEVSPTPLPNFDYKFMQGNSLLECYNGVELNLMKSSDGSLDFAEAARNDLQELLRNYFDCTDHKVKNSLQKDIENKIQKILELQTYTIDLSGINLAGNDQFFLWHTWFADVFDKGGFDIVIGNPPYINFSKFKKIGQLYKSYKYDLENNPNGYRSFNSSGDIYCLFYELAINILKIKGVSCYITSNKWLRSDYGQNIRNLILDNSKVEELIDFSGIKVFPNAEVDVNIILLAKQKGVNQSSFMTCALDSLYRCFNDFYTNDCNADLYDYVLKNHVQSSFIKDESWAVLTREQYNIIQKISSVGTSIKSMGCMIYRGILTGYNDAFIINTKKRDEILNCCDDIERNGTEKIIQPLIRGYNLKRYSYYWDDNWLINTHNGIRDVIPPIDINSYTEIKNHLNTFWSRISTRYDKGNTPYNLRNCAYLQDFERKKIVWPSVGATVYSYVEENKLLLDTNYFFATDKPYYFLAFLNSKLIRFWINSIDTPIGNDNAFRHYKYNIEKITLPPCNNFTSILDGYVDNIIKKINIEKNDVFITIIVYLLYDLTFDEVQIVESSSDNPIYIDKITYESWRKTYNKGKGILPSEKDMESAIRASFAYTNCTSTPRLDLTTEEIMTLAQIDHFTDYGFQGINCIDDKHKQIEVILKNKKIKQVESKITIGEARKRVEKIKKQLEKLDEDEKKRKKKLEKDIEKAQKDFAKKLDALKNKNHSQEDDSEGENNEETVGNNALEEKISQLNRECERDLTRIKAKITALEEEKKELEDEIAKHPGAPANTEITVIRNVSILGEYYRAESQIILYLETIRKSTFPSYKLFQTYIHEMFHAYYDANPAGPDYYIEKIEEPITELGALTFIEKITGKNKDKEFMDFAVAQVEKKQFNPAVCHYGFGAYLFKKDKGLVQQYYDNRSKIVNPSSDLTAYEDMFRIAYPTSESDCYENLKKVLGI